MFCTNCGARIPDDSEFCPNCGTRGTSISYQRLERDEGSKIIEDAIPTINFEPEAKHNVS